MTMILVVEDDAFIVINLLYNLENAGYRVRVEERGEMALRRIRLERPDLIVLDWMLPGVLSGFELCRRLKADSETKDIPIIMTTARGEPLDEQIVMSFGTDAYFVKPYNVSEVLQTIRSLLNLEASAT